MLFSLKSRKKAEDKGKSEEKRKQSKMDDFRDDFDLNDTPKKGDKKDRDFLSDFQSEFGETSSIQAPPRTRKNAGWSDGTPGKKSWLRKGSMNFLKDSPKKEVTSDTSPVNAEIPVIPDLDSMKEEELSADVAKAPSLAVSRIATFQELDSDLSKHAAFQSLDGIDLSILTKRLLPERLLKQEDETPWTWDTLFADVTSHCNATMASEDQNDSLIVDKISDRFERVL